MVCSGGWSTGERKCAKHPAGVVVIIRVRDINNQNLFHSLGGIIALALGPVKNHFRKTATSIFGNCFPSSAQTQWPGPECWWGRWAPLCRPKIHPVECSGLRCAPTTPRNH